MNYWLFKTEPDEYSLTDLASETDQSTCWDGIRNFQARNRLRDEVHKGDLVLIYHSACKQPAIVGLAEVIRGGLPEAGQFDPDSPLHDAKSRRDTPRWFQVRIQFLETFPFPVTLTNIKQTPELSEMELVKQSRLSVQVVTEEQFHHLYQKATGRETSMENVDGC